MGLFIPLQAVKKYKRVLYANQNIGILYFPDFPLIRKICNHLKNQAFEVISRWGQDSAKNVSEELSDDQIAHIEAKLSF